MSTHRNNNGTQDQRAAELHDGAAHAHRVAEQQGKQEHLTGHEHSRQALEHSQDAHWRTPVATTEHGVILFGHDDIAAPSRMNYGKRGAVRTDHRRKIGTMPRKNGDPMLIPVDSARGDHGCPKCGVEMESIEIGVEGLPLQQLQLCPGCYLVTWRGQDGLHVRQGVPVKRGVNLLREPTWLVGEPEEC